MHLGAGVHSADDLEESGAAARGRLSAHHALVSLPSFQAREIYSALAGWKMRFLDCQSLAISPWPRVSLSGFCSYRLM
jgi:hypothetical protein